MRLEGFLGSLFQGNSPSTSWDAGRVGLTQYLGLPGVVEATRPTAGFIGPGQGMAGWGQVGRRMARGAAEETLRGGASAVLPISPMNLQRGAGGASKAAKGLLGGLGKVAGPALGIAFGMGMTGYRLATEARGQGLAGNMVAGANVVNEQMWDMAGFGIGGFLGGAAGSFLLPGIGTVVGTIIGGMVGSSVLRGTAGRITGAAITAPYAGYKFMHDLGVRSRRLELGGRVSAANTTRLAATMRQRALGEINRSGMNARSILGQEAGLMHLRS